MDILDYAQDGIRIFIMIPFGGFSILYFLIRFFNRNTDFINQCDKLAVSLIIYSGIAFGISWIFEILIHYWQLENTLDKLAFKQRLFGKYSFGFWFQCLFWVLLSQILRIKIVKNLLLFRIAISLLFLFSFERIMIISTSLHKDYLPSNWFPDISVFEILMGHLLHIFIFTFFVLMIQLIINFFSKKI